MIHPLATHMQHVQTQMAPMNVLALLGIMAMDGTAVTETSAQGSLLRVMLTPIAQTQ